MSLEGLKPVFEIFDFIIRLWLLWLVIGILGIWKFIEILIYLIGHVKLS